MLAGSAALSADHAWKTRDDLGGGSFFGHVPSAATAALVAEAGGVPGLQRMTDEFYRLVFADPLLDTFVGDRALPHGARFARWIAETLGAPGAPWSADCAARRAAGDAHVDLASSHLAARACAKRGAKATPPTPFSREDVRVLSLIHI